MLTEKREDLQEMFEMASFHTDVGLKPLSPLIDDPIKAKSLTNDHTSTRCCFSSLMSRACALLINMDLEDSPKFCNRPDRSGNLGGQTSGEMK